MPNKPVKKFRVGFVNAAVWENDGFHNVTISRSYKNADGEWQDGDSFNHGDLLNAAKALERAEAFIAEQS